MGESQSAWLGYTEPAAPPFGLSVQQLLAHQYDLSRMARGRLIGPGAEQYSLPAHQSFEDRTVAELVQEAREELLDVQNYCVMLDIMLQRVVVKAAEIEERTG